MNLISRRILLIFLITVTLNQFLSEYNCISGWTYPIVDLLFNNRIIQTILPEVSLIPHHPSYQVKLSTSCRYNTKVMRLFSLHVYQSDHFAMNRLVALIIFTRKMNKKKLFLKRLKIFFNESLIKESPKQRRFTVRVAISVNDHPRAPRSLAISCSAFLEILL